jgi:hypothetical protein
MENKPRKFEDKVSVPKDQIDDESGNDSKAFGKEKKLGTKTRKNLGQKNVSDKGLDGLGVAGLPDITRKYTRLKHQQVKDETTTKEANLGGSSPVKDLIAGSSKLREGARRGPKGAQNSVDKAQAEANIKMSKQFATSEQMRTLQDYSQGDEFHTIDNELDPRNNLDSDVFDNRKKTRGKSLKKLKKLPTNKKSSTKLFDLPSNVESLQEKEEKKPRKLSRKIKGTTKRDRTDLIEEDQEGGDGMAIQDRDQDKANMDMKGGNDSSRRQSRKRSAKKIQQEIKDSNKDRSTSILESIQKSDKSREEALSLRKKKKLGNVIANMPSPIVKIAPEVLPEIKRETSLETGKSRKRLVKPLLSNKKPTVALSENLENNMRDSESMASSNNGSSIQSGMSNLMNKFQLKKAGDLTILKKQKMAPYSNSNSVACI